jgi:hypothetical protein
VRKGVLRGDVAFDVGKVLVDHGSGRYVRGLRLSNGNFFLVFGCMNYTCGYVSATHIQ